MNNIYPYAGFWKRAAAWFIDSIVIYMATMLVQQVLGPLLMNQQALQQLQQMQDKSAPFDPAVFTSLVPLGIGWLVLSVVLPWLYFALMESSSKQATLGKMALGIKVVGEDGNRIGFARALGRTLGKIVSGLILNIGYYMAGATRKKQALHDKMAHAYVVDKAFQPGDDLPDVETHFGILGTIIGAMILVIVLFVALLVGIISYAVKHVSSSNPPATQTTQVQQTL